MGGCVPRLDQVPATDKVERPPLPPTDQVSKFNSTLIGVFQTLASCQKNDGVQRRLATPLSKMVFPVEPAVLRSSLAQ